MTKSNRDSIFKGAIVLQITVAVVVTATIVMLGIFVNGPDIDGRTPPLSDSIKDGIMALIIIAAYIWSAIQLKRATKIGWWLSLSLDAILTLSVATMVWGDLKEIGSESATVVKSDISFHCPVLLLGLAAIVMLLASRQPRHSQPESL